MKAKVAPMPSNVDELLISFDPPLVWNGEPLDSLHLTEPTAAQLEKGGKLAIGDSLSSTTAFQIELVTAVSSKTRQYISQMKISDLRKATEFIMGFIVDSAPDGGTS
jgi:hypothetical protein